MKSILKKLNLSYALKDTSPSTILVNVEWIGPLYTESILYASLKTPAAFIMSIIIKAKAMARITSIKGWITHTTMLTVIDLNIPKVASTLIDGKMRSKTLTSFENLVYILPMGLESKKITLALMTCSTIQLCMLVVLI